MPAVDEVLDGYRLIRLIGSGGFGDVWLCRMESTGEYRALKFVPQTRIRHLDRELQALRIFRREIELGAATSLVSIEHINRCETGLFYVMPLADGPPTLQIHDDLWKPLTLEAAIVNRRSAPKWFAVEEIVGIFRPLALAAQALADAGLVHRDIKPQNILFFGGLPRLADIGLVSVDDAELSEMGTPGYVAPRWYLAAHGNPDMWGLAATLYHCATGNHPDYMSRPAYRWPPSGKEEMTAVERQRWLALLGVAYRATQENPSERFIQFRDMANALDTLSPVYPDVSSRQPQSGSRKRPSRIFIVLLVCLVVLVLIGVRWHETKMDELANFPTIASESGARSNNAISDAPAPGDFENALQAAKRTFDSLIQDDRKIFLGDHPTPNGDDVAFRNLVRTLANQSGAPMTQIRETFKQMKASKPGIDLAIHRIDTGRLNKSVDELYAAANYPQQLAHDSKEAFQADRLSGDLLDKVTSFQDEVNGQNLSSLEQASDLQEQLRTATNKLVDAREKAIRGKEDPDAVQVENNEIYRLCDEVDKEVLNSNVAPRESKLRAQRRPRIDRRSRPAGLSVPFVSSEPFGEIPTCPIYDHRSQLPGR